MLVDIDSLPDATLSVTLPIPALVERIDPSNFTAEVSTAGVFASGDTPGEALENLKDMVASTFLHFSSLPPERLGPVPSHQLTILKQHIAKK